MNPFVASLQRGLAALAALALLTVVAPAPSIAAPAKPVATKTTKAAKAPKASKPKAPKKSYAEQKAENGVYTRGTNWLSGRFGWSKRAGRFYGDGLVGYGLQYTRMLDNRYAVAFGVDRDVVGQFGRQIDESVPFTVEFQRHFRWRTAVRPFVGVGAGYYVRKYYRTGDDYSSFTTVGQHLSFGFTSALDDRHVIGVEARVAQLKGRGPSVTNVTFGPSGHTDLIWTIKATYSLAY